MIRHISEFEEVKKPRIFSEDCPKRKLHREGIPGKKIEREREYYFEFDWILTSGLHSVKPHEAIRRNFLGKSTNWGAKR